jgi:hypothetical protein
MLCAVKTLAHTPGGDSGVIGTADPSAGGRRRSGAPISRYIKDTLMKKTQMKNEKQF